MHGSKTPDDGVRKPTYVEVNTDILFYTCWYWLLKCKFTVTNINAELYFYGWSDKCANLMLAVVSLGRQAVRCL